MVSTHLTKVGAGTSRSSDVRECPGFLGSKYTQLTQERAGMSDAILQFAHELMSSWWIYVALWGFAALDGFFPAIPSETLVVTEGVFAAASGEPDPYAVIVVAAV